MQINDDYNIIMEENITCHVHFSYSHHTNFYRVISVKLFNIFQQLIYMLNHLYVVENISIRLQKVIITSLMPIPQQLHLCLSSYQGHIDISVLCKTNVNSNYGEDTI